jgi:hypothetical protein
LATFVAVALVAACGRRAAEEQRRLEALASAIGSAPLSDDAARRLAPQKADLEAFTADLEQRAGRKETARLDWELGECQRLRHLFDEPGAWEQSERYLSLALARDPKFSAAHLSLGQLYLTGGFDWAPRAEREIVQAMEQSAGQPSPAAAKALFLAYYYQGRWKDAVQEADHYLGLVGHDDDVTQMRLMAEANGKRKGDNPS